MVGHFGSGFQGAVVQQIGGDAGGSERVICYAGFDPSFPSPTFDHCIGVGLGQFFIAEAAGFSIPASKQPAAWIRSQASLVQIFLKPSL